MKTPSKSNSNNGGPLAAIEEQMIREATQHVTAAEVALRKGCRHALLAGMRLLALHSQTVSVGGDRKSISVPHDTMIGFDGALSKIGIPRRTAYRWMNATLAAAKYYLNLEPDEFPAPADDNWQEMELAIDAQAERMSLRRLVIGCNKVNSEDQRQEALIAMAEDGSDIAEAILDKIANGEMTLVQAMRAAAGAIATRDKERRDPQYLTMDGRTGELGGLYVKSLTTLTNAFAKWQDLPAPARAKARTLWLELVSTLPSDLL